MSHVKHVDEAWALSLLDQIINRSIKDRDALPGKVVQKVKEAATILRKRRSENKVRKKGDGRD